ncbi:MAG: hypothetical protein ACJAYC_001169 [Halieaceae bacterium]|jgi:hypothetical protein
MNKCASASPKFRRRLELLLPKSDLLTSLDWPDEQAYQFLVDLDQDIDLGDGGQYSVVAKKNAAMRMLNVGVDHSAVAVWYVLADYAYKGSKGICFPSLTTIAGRVSLSRRAVIRWINYLVELGAVERLTRGNGRNEATRYFIITTWNPSFGLHTSGAKGDGNGTIPTKSNSDSSDTVPAEIVTPVTLNSDTYDTQIVTQVSHESIYETGIKPVEIDRQANAQKSSGAEAPCDLVAPPGELRLSEVFRRGWGGLKPREAKHTQRQLAKSMAEGDTPDEIADGLLRHLAWAMAWEKPPWQLAALLRTSKYHDDWDTRPPAKKDKPKAKAATRSTPAQLARSISDDDAASLGPTQARKIFDEHLKGDCKLCSSGGATPPCDSGARLIRKITG